MCRDPEVTYETTRVVEPHFMGPLQKQPNTPNRPQRLTLELNRGRLSTLWSVADMGKLPCPSYRVMSISVVHIAIDQASFGKEAAKFRILRLLVHLQAFATVRNFKKSGGWQTSSIDSATSAVTVLAYAMKAPLLLVSLDPAMGG